MPMTRIVLGCMAGAVIFGCTAEGGHSATASSQRPIAEANGLDVNGLDINGLDVNGLDVNGLYVNGLDINGLDINGLDINGLDINGLTLTKSDVQKNILLYYGYNVVGLSIIPAQVQSIVPHLDSQGQTAYGGVS